MSAIVQALAVLPNGDLIAGGSFTFADSVPATYIARWDGSTWFALGTGFRTAPAASSTATRCTGDPTATAR